jgi:putative tricarboxylic transport membrane protein
MTQESDEHSGGDGSGETTQSPWLRGDDHVGAVILVFCAVVVYLTTLFDEVPAMLSQGIPPTQFPRLLVGVIAVLVVMMVIQARTRRDPKKKPVPMVALMTAGILAVFVAAIEWTGTISAIVMFCIALPILWGERRFGWIAAYAVVFPIAVYLLFVKVLEVRFPTGLFKSFLG